MKKQFILFSPWLLKSPVKDLKSPTHDHPLSNPGIPETAPANPLLGCPGDPR